MKNIGVNWYFSVRSRMCTTLREVVLPLRISCHLLFVRHNHYNYIDTKVYKVDLRLKSETQEKILVFIIGNHSFEDEQRISNGTSSLLKHFPGIYLKIISNSILATSRSPARQFQLLKRFNILDTDKSLGHNDGLQYFGLVGQKSYIYQR